MAAQGSQWYHGGTCWYERAGSHQATGYMQESRGHRDGQHDRGDRSAKSMPEDAFNRQMNGLD